MDATLFFYVNIFSLFLYTVREVGVVFVFSFVILVYLASFGCLGRGYAFVYYFSVGPLRGIWQKVLGVLKK